MKKADFSKKGYKYSGGFGGAKHKIQGVAANGRESGRSAQVRKWEGGKVGKHKVTRPSPCPLPEGEGTNRRKKQRGKVVRLRRIRPTGGQGPQKVEQAMTFLQRGK